MEDNPTSGLISQEYKLLFPSQAMKQFQGENSCLKFNSGRTLAKFKRACTAQAHYFVALDESSSIQVFFFSFIRLSPQYFPQFTTFLNLRSGSPLQQIQVAAFFVRFTYMPMEDFSLWILTYSNTLLSPYTGHVSPWT